MPQLTAPIAVTETPAATPDVALAHFQSLLAFETDCWDVHQALDVGERGFVILDVRDPDSYARGHVPTAISLPHRKITERALSQYPPETLFVVYCTGPHCNGADKAAFRLARLGKPVKKMIGGIEGWKNDAFDLVTD